MLYNAFSSLPNKCVAKPNEHDCLWNTDTRSSGTTSLLVSKIKKIVFNNTNKLSVALRFT